MIRNILFVTALATLAIGGGTVNEPAQATVATSGTAMQRSTRTLDIIQKVRRICRMEWRCDRGPTSCHWQQVCQVSGDYPPEHGNNADQ